MRYPNVVHKLVLASANYRPDGYDSDPRDTDPAEVERRMPTPADFQQIRDAYHAVAPHPEHFDALLEKTSAMVRSFPGFEPNALRTITKPALLVFGDTDFTPLRNAVEMLDLIPNAQLAVLPGTTHMGVTRSGERLRGLTGPSAPKREQPAIPLDASCPVSLVLCVLVALYYFDVVLEAVQGVVECRAYFSHSRWLTPRVPPRMHGLINTAMPSARVNES